MSETLVLLTALSETQRAQVLDLPMELIFSQIGIPRGRGKIERFFRSVDQLLLQDIPGYAPKGATGVKATLTLPAFEQRFRTWLLETYHHRVHVETKCKPQERWEAGEYLPRLPKSLEQLDLLLLTVAKTRRVQQDGICFQGYCYFDVLWRQKAIVALGRCAMPVGVLVSLV